MTKRILLAGHCGPDCSHLQIVVHKALPGAQVARADDRESLDAAVAAGADLVLLNRQRGHGFGDALAVDLIRELRPLYPQTVWMVVSNYAEAQDAAVAAGAARGFGKRELGSQRTAQLLREAVGFAAASRAT